MFPSLRRIELGRAFWLVSCDSLYNQFAQNQHVLVPSILFSAIDRGHIGVIIEFKQTTPILRIFDVGKAKEFYCGFLGFEVQWQHHFSDDAPAYVELQRDGMTLYLSVHHGDCCPGSTVFVWMTGIEEFHDEITAKALKYNRPGLETTFYNAKCVQVTDPFGNRIRFNERIDRVLK